jgi:hypothetical protein
MFGRADNVVRPPGKQVSGVDDDRVGDGRRLDVLSVWALDFETADIILEEES